MRFTSGQDYYTMKVINKELINTVVDTPVTIFKLYIQKTKINIYGESTNKNYYAGVQVPCLFSQDNTLPTNETGVIDVAQKATFAFLRTELEARNIYPEMGDIINFNTQYYEVNNTNETQLYAGQVLYNHQVLCDVNLLSKAPLQLEKPIL